MEVNLHVELLSITPNALDLIERAIRICHDSEISKTKEKQKDLIERIALKMGHESVIEHASATFHIKGISRACSHQLVRHRIGVAFSQRSQRYVKEYNFEFIVPKSIKDKKLDYFYKVWMEDIGKNYEIILNSGIPAEDARFILPNSCSTELIMTMNFRELRHFLKERLSKRAQWEIRNVAKEILRLLKEQVDVIFDDLGDNI